MMLQQRDLKVGNPLNDEPCNKIDNEFNYTVFEDFYLSHVNKMQSYRKRQTSQMSFSKHPRNGLQVL